MTGALYAFNRRKSLEACKLAIYKTITVIEYHLNKNPGHFSQEELRRFSELLIHLRPIDGAIDSSSIPKRPLTKYAAKSILLDMVHVPTKPVYPDKRRRGISLQLEKLQIGESCESTNIEQNSLYISTMRWGRKLDREFKIDVISSQDNIYRVTRTL